MSCSSALTQEVNFYAQNSPAQPGSKLRKCHASLCLRNFLRVLDLISILAIFGAVIGFAILAPTPVADLANPYADPPEISSAGFSFPPLRISGLAP